jgi:hypothetical protein
VSTRKPWVVAVVGLFTVVAVIAFVLASAMIGVPSETSVPLLILLAFISLGSFRNRHVH